MAATRASPAPWDEVVEVVIIGSGPAALGLSSALSGFLPYYAAAHHDASIHNKIVKECTRAARKLCKDPEDVPLTAIDLQRVSSGLTGRSNNPVALFFDALFHPQADGSIYPPPASCLKIQHDPTGEISHVFIGEGQIGGSWALMDESTETVSPGFWMELPGFPLSSYISRFCPELGEQPGGLERIVDGRVSRSLIYQYYLQYAQEMNLLRNFRQMKVTSIYKKKAFQNRRGGWVVECACESGKSMIFAKTAVVLAVGMYDVPKLLGIRGENCDCVHHRIPKFTDYSTMKRKRDEVDGKKVLVVGAGLSAGDCIKAAFQNNWKVIHVFKSSPNKTRLAAKFSHPSAMYMDYFQIVQLMKGNYALDLYERHPNSHLKRVDDDGTCIIEHENGKTDHQHVNLVSILIGSKPDLSILHTEHFLKYPVHHPCPFPLSATDKKAVHEVWLNVDPFSMEVADELSLYAIGPLRGDNFVRFFIGDFYAVTKHISDHLRK